MSSEIITLKENNTKNPDTIIYGQKNTNIQIKLPFDVSTDLNQFKQIYISRQFDIKRVVCCCNHFGPDFLVWGELPDGDRKIIFTIHNYYEFCKWLQSCRINFCLCGHYYCCDTILYQLNYQRNGKPFYSQGVNVKNGCYCCKCEDCFFNSFCCCSSILNMKENLDHNSRIYENGMPKGTTEVRNICCCCCCVDKTSTYNTQLGPKGQTVRGPCCKYCKFCCSDAFFCTQYCCNCDFEMDIEDEQGQKTGNIMIYKGVYSKKSEGYCCTLPLRYMELNLPTNASSEQKFQIIADAIHMTVAFGLI